MTIISARFATQSQWNRALYNNGALLSDIPESVGQCHHQLVFYSTFCNDYQYNKLTFGCLTCYLISHA